MFLHNSINNKLYDLTEKKDIKLYCCGPTIYNDSHMGHARTYITFDTMIRYMRKKNINVTYAMNITDIDDKIIKKVNEIPDASTNESVNEKYTEFIKNQEQRFWDDLKSLNINMPDKISRVSDVIPQIIDFINVLIKKDFAYESKGSVYFDTEKYSSKYPKILDNSTEDDMNIKDGFTSEKKNSKDFALWKSYKPNEIYWDSPWGKGRVGWHLECSVMMNEMLGEHVDIHCGGCDLKFPHHHNEYLQTTAYFDNPDWVSCFLHSGHLHTNNQKMSQSLGNFRTIREFLQKYTPNQTRLLFLTHQWNDQCDLSPDTILCAQELDSRIYNFLKHLEHLQHQSLTMDCPKYILPDLDIDLDNNFNTPGAFRSIRKLIDDFYIKDQKHISNDNIIAIQQFMQHYFDIFGLVYTSEPKIDISIVESIIQIRNNIRAVASSKDTDIKVLKKELFKICDWIRDIKLPELGVVMQDTQTNTKWFYK